VRRPPRVASNNPNAPQGAWLHRLRVFCCRGRRLACDSCCSHGSASRISHAGVCAKVWYSLFYCFLAFLGRFLYKKGAARWNTSRGSPNGSDKLRDAESGKRRLIDYRCHSQSMVGLEGCDSFPGHLPEYTIDRSIVITVPLQL